MRKKAIIYGRVSTVKQADKDLPIDSQIEAGRKCAEDLQADVLRVFVDAGISGSRGDRAAFLDAIEYAGVFDIDYFIVWDTKRFARNRVDAAVFKRDLRRGGTKIVYVANDIDGDTDEGWMLEGMMELVDESQRRTVSKDTRRSLMKNARDGFFNGGQCPFGYRVVPAGKRKRLEIDEAEAPVARWIFAEYLRGAGIVSITASLRTAGNARRGRPWTRNTVNNTLKNWVYAGFNTFNRINHSTRVQRPPEDWIRTKSHAELISLEDFMRVQKTLGEREPVKDGGSAKSTFLFTGMLKCGACECTMKISTGTGRSKTYSYYNCGNAIKGQGCAPRPIRASELDKCLVDHILDRILSPARLAEIAGQIYELKGAWVKEREAKRASVVAELRDIEQRQARLYDVLELHGKDAPNLGDLTIRLRGLNARAKAIQETLTALELQAPPTAIVDESQLDELGEFMRDLIERCESPRKVREFFASFIDKVVITEKQALIRYRPDRLVNARGFDVVRSTEKWLPDLGISRTVQLAVDLPARFLRRAA